MAHQFLCLYNPDDASQLRYQFGLDALGLSPSVFSTSLDRRPWEAWRARLGSALVCRQAASVWRQSTLDEVEMRDIRLLVVPAEDSWGRCSNPLDHQHTTRAVHSRPEGLSNRLASHRLENRPAVAGWPPDHHDARRGDDVNILAVLFLCPILLLFAPWFFLNNAVHHNSSTSFICTIMRLTAPMVALAISSAAAPALAAPVPRPMNEGDATLARTVTESRTQGITGDFRRQLVRLKNWINPHFPTFEGLTHEETLANGSSGAEIAATGAADDHALGAGVAHPPSLPVRVLQDESSVSNEVVSGADAEIKASGHAVSGQTGGMASEDVVSSSSHRVNVKGAPLDDDRLHLDNPVQHEQPQDSLPAAQDTPSDFVPPVARVGDQYTGEVEPALRLSQAFPLGATEGPPGALSLSSSLGSSSGSRSAAGLSQSTVDSSGFDDLADSGVQRGPNDGTADDLDRKDHRTVVDAPVLRSELRSDPSSASASSEDEEDTLFGNFFDNPTPVTEEKSPLPSEFETWSSTAGEPADGDNDEAQLPPFNHGSTGGHTAPRPPTGYMDPFSIIGDPDIVDSTGSTQATSAPGLNAHPAFSQTSVTFPATENVAAGAEGARPQHGTIAKSPEPKASVRTSSVDSGPSSAYFERSAGAGTSPRRDAARSASNAPILPGAQPELAQPQDTSGPSQAPTGAGQPPSASGPNAPMDVRGGSKGQDVSSSAPSKGAAATSAGTGTKVAAVVGITAGVLGGAGLIAGSAALGVEQANKNKHEYAQAQAAAAQTNASAARMTKRRAPTGYVSIDGLD